MIIASVSVLKEPTSEPITLATAKNHLRIDAADTSQDTLINSLIKAAREFCEFKQRRAYCLTDILATLDAVPYSDGLGKAETVRLLILPIKTIKSVEIIQTDGVTIRYYTIPAAEYDIDKTRGLFKLNNRHNTAAYDTDKMPSFSGLRIIYTAGLDTENETTPELIPARIIQSMLLIIGHWYEHREDATDGFEVKKIPMAADALLQQGKVY